MIERFYLKSCLTFNEATLDFKPGLIVFSGPSGSGKSVLMRSILASVGFDDALAEVSESSLSWQLDEEETGLVNEDLNIFKQVKKEKVRYFINNQSVSKRTLQGISEKHMRHLSLKDYSDFDQHNLLGIIDRQVAAGKPGHEKEVETFKNELAAYKSAQQRLAAHEEEEKRMLDLKEFAEFEVAKIDRIDPKQGEYDELIEIKKALSRKEKSEEKLLGAEGIFEFEASVSELLGGLDIDTGFFDDAMNELRVRFDDARSLFDELEEVNIEEVLDRLEQLSDLKHRYGSIEEAIAYRDTKAKELLKYEHFEAEKSALFAEKERRYNTLITLGKSISLSRSEALYDVNAAINGYLKQLYLKNAELSLFHGDFNAYGQDRVEFNLRGVPLEKISAGEFNRLRLALLAVRSESMTTQSGVLMLDEIDANLSGEESMSVARVLRKMSSVFQIFVISHQPQLTAMGEQHFLVSKDTHSQVAELTHEQRVKEIARMISGDTVTQEATRFAKELLMSSQGMKAQPQ